MPELPEVETVKRGLEPNIRNKAIIAAYTGPKRLRVEYPAGLVKILKKQKVIGLKRRSKYILIELSGGKVLVVHLGMSGKLLYLKKPPKEYGLHDHFYATFDDGSQIVFNDPRRFGLITLVEGRGLEKHKLFCELGPEPLEEGFDGKYLHTALKGRAQAIKQAIMDAHNLVGVGNIYASEALFRSNINPTKAAGKISAVKLEELAENIKTVLLEAIESGGSTLRDYVRSNGDVGGFQHRFKVYGREKEPCLNCGTSIERIVQQGRSTYYCPVCQK